MPRGALHEALALARPRSGPLAFPMANPALRLAGNASGPLFVDESCIDCETCRQLAPEVFTRSAKVGRSVVARQPAGAFAWDAAALALVACPTSSIGVSGPHDKARLLGAAHAFPLPLGEGEDEQVSYCGYASEASFGASSYFIRRAGGNVLVDSPRASKILMDRLEALGGVRFMFLSHRDDVADHAAFRERFGCNRILHADDVDHGTREVERQLEGSVPTRLAPDLLVVPTPGHTRGSACLLYRDRYLFTGDHLWADEDTGALAAGRSVCWYSWSEQTRSMKRLLELDFEWVLPGTAGAFTPRARRQCAPRWVSS